MAVNQSFERRGSRLAANNLSLGMALQTKGFGIDPDRRLLEVTLGPRLGDTRRHKIEGVLDGPDRHVRRDDRHRIPKVSPVPLQDRIDGARCNRPAFVAHDRPHVFSQVIGNNLRL